MGGKVGLTRAGGGRGTYLAGFPLVPVPVRHPPGRCVGVSPACPGAKLHPGEPIQATQGRLTSPGAGVIGPTAYFGVELVDQGRLGPVLPSPHDATQLRKRFLPIGLGRGNEGCVPEALIAPRSCTRWMFPHPILTDGATENVHSRLIAFHGVAHRRFAAVQCQPDPRSPCRQKLLTVIERGALRVEHQAVIGVRDNPSCRRARGDGRVHPLPSHQREERRTAAALGCSCLRGHARVRCDDPCTSPRSYVPTDVRWCWEFGQERRVINTVKTLRNIDLPQILRPKFDAVKDRGDSIPAGTSWPQPIRVGRQLRFPLGFSDLPYPCLPGPFVLGWKTERTLCRAPAFRNPRAPQRGGLAGEGTLASQPESMGRGEPFRPIDPRRGLAAMVLAHTPHRSQTGVPGLEHQVVELVSRADLAPLRGLVHALWEAEDMPMDLLPGCQLDTFFGLFAKFEASV